MKLKVINAFKENFDTKTIVFEKNNFKFKPGQYLALKLEVKDPKGNMRTFSISSSPTENFLSITTKITNSPFKQLLDNLKVGDKIEINGPYGSFILDENKDAIMLTGGIGITPLRSMIKYSVDKKLKSNQILFYSNKIPEEQLYSSEFEKFSKYSNFKKIDTITRVEESKENWEGITGRIDKNLIIKHVKDLNQIFYISGSRSMVEEILKILEEMNIPKENIKSEFFSGYQ